MADGAARERIEPKDARRGRTMPVSTLARTALASGSVEERVRRGFRVCSRVLRKRPEEGDQATAVAELAAALGRERLM